VLGELAVPPQQVREPVRVEVDVVEVPDVIARVASSASSLCISCATSVTYFGKNRNHDVLEPEDQPGADHDDAAPVDAQ